jgi:hypothetical protein
MEKSVGDGARLAEYQMKWSRQQKYSVRVAFSLHSTLKDPSYKHSQGMALKVSQILHSQSTSNLVGPTPGTSFALLLSSWYQPRLTK